MKTLIISFTLTLLSSYHAYSQTTEYKYSCGENKTTIYWNESREGNLIYLQTILGSEAHKYVMTLDYHTVSWEYSNQDKNTNIKVVLRNGTYKIDGILKSKSYSKTYKSNGVPWFQNIGFNMGYSIKKKPTFKFECIRPDNLKLYEMQADVKEIIVRNGIREQRINVHLTGLISKFFGCDYYINFSSGQFTQYKGVQGVPGTPETIITIKK